MSKSNTAGFTIIETVMVLSISSLLVMGILVGTGASINIQRYRDSVNTLQSYLQHQYSEVANVINDSTSNDCNGTTTPRGRSDCVILGRYITTNDGKILTVERVVGKIKDTASTNDIDALKDYMQPYFKVEPIETQEVDWGVSLANSAAMGGGNMKFSILILKSPMSGTIHTFIDTTSVISASAASSPNIVSGLLSDPNSLKRDALLCMNPNGLSTQPRMAVIINKGASGPNEVEILGDNSGC